MNGFDKAARVEASAASSLKSSESICMKESFTATVRLAYVAE
jgi:hypothetical protein